MKEVGKPRALRPVRGDQSELHPRRHAKLRQHSGKNRPRREGVGLKPVPTLEEGVRARCQRIPEGREKDRTLVIGGRGKQVDLHRPKTTDKSEKPPGEGTILYEGAGEDERGSPLGRSVTPE